MKVIWSKSALKKVSKTADYIETEYGKKSKNKFLKKVFHITELLENNPKLGQTELLLEDAPLKFRSYIIDKYNRIIYYTNNYSIEIVDFWDMRRNPDTLKKEFNF